MRRKQFTLCIRVPYPLLHQIHRKFILHSPKDRIPNPAPSLCASVTLYFKIEPQNKQPSLRGLLETRRHRDRGEHD